MFRKLLFFIFIIGFVGASIKAQTQLPLKNDEIPSDLEINLTRTICFGSCSSYTLLIKSSGDVFFDGKSDTLTKGKAEGKITQKQIKQLINEFEKAEFFELKDRYVREKDGCKEVWTDNPGEIISIR